MENSSVLCCVCFLLLYITSSTSLDTIAPGQLLRDRDTIVSTGRTFELGFFSPGNSKNRYFGIWYSNVSPLTVVWVANREAPINNTSGVVTFNDQGAILLLNGLNSTVWSSNVSRKFDNPVAQIQDSGNLVVKNGNGSGRDSIIWQSFDYPCDTLLPGMKLGWDLETGLNRVLSSWKSADDPAHGEFVLMIDIHGYPQVYQLNRQGIMFRVGSWNGLAFSGYTTLKPNPIFSYEFVLNEKEVYYQYKLLSISVQSRIILSPSGIRQRVQWTNYSNRWEIYAMGPVDQCQSYALCGAYSNCDVNRSPVCSCLKGFEPKSKEKWNALDWSAGCVRKTALDCNEKDGFIKYTRIKVPDTSSSWYNKIMSLQECEQKCLRNCSCTAYTNLDVRGVGSGCLLWFGELIDIRDFNDGGEDIYVRVAASELGIITTDVQNYRKKLVGTILGIAIFVLCMTVLGLAVFLFKKNLQVSGFINRFGWKHCENKMRKEDMDLPTFDFSTMAKATDNFSSSNILGEGGFGPVYKGTLPDDQELAVKRLSKSSGQGLKEFKNEVMLITKLQHRNLVKLLGCCIDEDEKMLIYEYMSNKSLDHFIFDESKRKFLDWHMRIDIIGGIARGLLYLHQDSRLTIIHRDLKTSNILLDKNMNPKISDFGLASTFWGDQAEANTNRVVGTYGYMPPEYAVHGNFSVKSDVFSFGAIVLEILSGQKIREFSHAQHDLNLLGHAWRLWIESRPSELMDTSLDGPYNPSEVLRCMNVGLLCVQHRPEDRPNMSSVVLMLNSENVLPTPKCPGFCTGNDVLMPHSPLERRRTTVCSSNDISITIVEAR